MPFPFCALISAGLFFWYLETTILELLAYLLELSIFTSTLEKDVITPKQSLLNGMMRLGDPKFKRYSLTERETFVFDRESILKILTFKETVFYCFPCLDVYASEQEYLQVELFR